MLNKLNYKILSRKNTGNDYDTLVEIHNTQGERFNIHFYNEKSNFEKIDIIDYLVSSGRFGNGSFYDMKKEFPGILSDLESTYNQCEFINKEMERLFPNYLDSWVLI